METRQCAGCGKHFHPRPQSPQQKFCSEAACQKERRRRWQAAKRQSDPDYRENQARAQAKWVSSKPKGSSNKDLAVAKRSMVGSREIMSPL